MATPAAGRLGVRDHGPNQVAKDGLEDGQGEPGASHAEGGVAEGTPGQERDVSQGGVAMENLDEEPVDGRDRGQQGRVAPGVAGGQTGVANHVVAEGGGDVLPEPVEDGRNSSMHRRGLLCHGLWEKTMVHGGPCHLKT